MSKITHKKKVKLAKQIQTPKELREHVPIFQTKGWLRRSLSKLLKFKKK